MTDEEVLREINERLTTIENDMATMRNNHKTMIDILTALKKHELVALPKKRTGKTGTLGSE